MTVPPHDIDAERGALGCVLLSPRDNYNELKAALPSNESFYDLRHQTILDNMDENTDCVILCQKLKAKGVLEQVGGFNYISALQDAAPTLSNLPYWVPVIRAKHLARKVIQVCSEAIQSAYSATGDADGLLDAVERDILAIRQDVKEHESPPVKQLVKEALAEIETSFNNKGSISGLATGLSDLDRGSDGLHPQEMIVIAAQSSVGKTSLALNIAECVLLQQHLSVGIFSMEMSAVSLVKRFILSHARVNMQNVRRGILHEHDFKNIATASAKISNAAIYFEDESNLSINKLRAKARRMWQRYGIKLLIVDYLQLLYSDGSNKGASREQEVAAISRGIKALAKELNIPVIALSQLNDEGKLRESRAIGQDADGVWLLERQKEESPAESPVENITLWLKKQRNGERNVKIDLQFRKALTRFEQPSKMSDSDVPTRKSTND